MTEFSLFKQLMDPPAPKTPTSGIEYQNYEINIAGILRTVSVPLRESTNFEKSLVEAPQPMTEIVLKNLLRDFRGVRG